ncbi:TPA: M23 family peptidase, partial [Burkholderia cenocepacia]|nr:M23 family peptidase [Burkholderia cenocepacia]
MVKSVATPDAVAPGRAQRAVRALVPAAVLGALAAFGLAAALPAVSQLPGAVDSGTAALPQRVLS